MAKTKMKYPSKRTPKECIAIFEAKKSARFVWDNHWREIADFMLPRKNDILRQQIAGSKKGIELFDNTAMHSLELLASALHGLLTNPAAYFFDLTSGIPEIDDDDDCRRWMQDSTRRMHNVLNDSNFQTEVHEFYLDLCGFGTAPMSMEEDQKFVVRFRSWHVKNCFLEEDAQGMVSGLDRYFEWNARKIVQRFKIENVSKEVKKAYDKGDESTLFKVIHCVYQGDPEANDPHKFISQYVEVDERHELSVGGFNEFPYITSRWTKIAEEMYGRSPGMTALPEAKTINEMTKATLIAAQKMIDPPLQLPDDGFILPIKTKPGGLNYYRAGSQDKITPLFNQEIRLDLSDSQRDASRNRIKEAFYVDQLSLGTQNPQMTATEVNTRNDQAMTLLGPMLGRQNSEFLQPTITRLFAIMNRRGLLKPVPLKLANHGKVNVNYSSLIAKAQRLVESRAIDSFVNSITPFVNADPSVKDNLDGDAAVRLIAKIKGVPQEIIMDTKKRDKIRSDRAKAQEKMQQQQDQTQQADVASKILPATAQAQMAQKQTMGGVGG